MAIKHEVDVRVALVQLRIDAICRVQMAQHPSELSRNWNSGMGPVGRADHPDRGARRSL